MTDKMNKLREGIVYFEQVLQMMPEDRPTLEFLSIAYKQTGQEDAYRRTLLSLADVLITERDYESARALLANLESEKDPQLQAVSLRLRAMLGTVAGGVPSVGAFETTPQLEEITLSIEGALQTESALIDKWVTWGIISSDQASTLKDQLRALAATSDLSLISALSILEKEGTTESEFSAFAEVALARVADESHAPPLAIETIESVYSMAKELPEGLVRRRGVLLFGSVAGERLVAIANPLDENLKRLVAAKLGAPCHFYLALPQSLAIVLSRLYSDESKTEAFR